MVGSSCMEPSCSSYVRRPGVLRGRLQTRRMTWGMLPGTVAGAKIRDESRIGVRGLVAPLILLSVPELPEVEITARRLDRAVAKAEIKSALAPGMNTMKTFDPPLDSLEG